MPIREILDQLLANYSWTLVSQGMLYCYQHGWTMTLSGLYQLQKEALVKDLTPEERLFFEKYYLQGLDMTCK